MNTSTMRSACLAAAALASMAAGAQQPQAVKTTGLTPAQVSALLEKPIERSARIVPGEVIVKMKDTEGVALPGGELRALDLEVKTTTTSGGEVIYRLPPDDLESMSATESVNRTLAAVAELRKRPDVEYVQPNYLVQIAATPNDPFYAAQWHYPAINLPAAWDTQKGGAGIVVAVIDTGILKTHADIGGSANMLPGVDLISDAARANDGDGRDADSTDTGDAVVANECGPGRPARPSSWHGTHVAGTVGITGTNNGVGIAGVNWTVKVQPVRVLGKCGGTMADINDAIRWAAGLPVPGVAANPTKARVINMSLGGASPCSASPATQSAINDARAAGVTIVVAAGNEASDASGFLPASCTGVITVAASDFNGNLVTRYSNFGARIDLLAPGGDVQADANGDGNPDGVLSAVNGGYNFYNGTSMAAPHVAGAVALHFAQDASLTPDSVLALLKANAVPRTNTQCPRPCGQGLLRVVFPAPLPPAVIKVTLSKNKLKKNQTATVTALVTRGGNPDAGKPVSFSSDDTTVATVAPATATTDAGGNASAVVQAGAKKGTANIKAESQGASADAAVKRVPSLPMGYLALLAVFVLLALGWQSRRARGATHAD